MGNYYYEGGANHYDHHKEVTINMESQSDAKSILREILADDIEDIDYEVVGDEDKVAEQSATMESKIPPANNSGGGRKPDSLFKDETITDEWANIFTAFLNKHNKTGCQKINSKRENYINKAIVAFLIYWKKKGLITIGEGNYKGRPCFKFLTENCGKESEISIETYNSFFINCMKDKEYTDKCKGLLVEDFITDFRINSQINSI
ncbi:MAG: hypothetical protein ACI3YT_05370 [Prevotella sp.]